MRGYKQSPFSFKLYDYFLIIFLAVLGVFLQQYQFFNGDGSWHLEAAKRMLQGATYSNGLFDDNLPMSYWFFVPSVLINHYFSINKILVSNCIITLCILISYILFNFSFEKIYSNKSRWQLNVMRYSVLLFFLFFPIGEFSGRDFLVAVFYLPYIALHAAEDQKSPIFFKIIVGFWAFIGSAMNPFYLLVIAALEIQFWLKNRKIFRVEIVTLFFLMLFYLLLMQLFYPDYFSKVIPAFFVFSKAYNASAKELIFYPPGIIVLIALIVPLFCLKIIFREAFLKTLWIVSIVGYGIYIMHQKSWMSHLIFTEEFLLLLLIGTACEIVKEKSMDLKTLSAMSLIVFELIYPLKMIFIFPVLAYLNFSNPNTTTNQVLNYFHKQPAHSSLYVFSTRIQLIGKIMSYTTMTNITPWPNDWALPMIESNRGKSLTGWQLELLNQYKNSFMETTISDLKVKKPRYILFEFRATKKYFSSVSVDYFSFLKQSPEFLNLWKNYHLDKKVPVYNDGRLEGVYYIYARS